MFCPLELCDTGTPHLTAEQYHLDRWSSSPNSYFLPEAPLPYLLSLEGWPLAAVSGRSLVGRGFFSQKTLPEHHPIRLLIHYCLLWSCPFLDQFWNPLSYHTLSKYSRLPTSILYKVCYTINILSLSFFKNISSILNLFKDSQKRGQTSYHWKKRRNIKVC